LKYDHEKQTIECTEKEIEDMRKGQRYHISIGAEITHFFFCENEVKVAQAEVNSDHIPMGYVVIIKEVHDKPI